MASLALQRCLNHSAREAVARCPECGQFYCRECITEHDERVICASCLHKLVQAVEKPVRRRWNLWPIFQSAAGVVVAFLVFYSAARMLVVLPEKFIEDMFMRVFFPSEIEGVDNL
jgi:hypothetical protein